jgi:hypothetical protein
VGADLQAALSPVRAAPAMSLSSDLNLLGQCNRSQALLATDATLATDDPRSLYFLL